MQEMVTYNEIILTNNQLEQLPVSKVKTSDLVIQ